FATAGVHPHHASEPGAQREAELEELARAPEVVAVGECGLDYYRDFSPRDAHTDFVAILREHAPAWRGVAHCFTGSAEELSCYLELGLAIGITGWICDERRGSHLAALMPKIPAGRLLVETDGP